jgi:cytochrome c
MKRLATLSVITGVVWGSAVLGGDLPSAARGKELFDSRELGTNGKSCATCHPDGKRLQGVGALADDDLAATVNACLSGPLKGKPLDPDSADMKSLVLYLKGFANPGK